MLKKIISLVFVRNKTRPVHSHSSTLCSWLTAPFIHSACPLGICVFGMTAIAFVGHRTVAACFFVPITELQHSIRAQKLSAKKRKIRTYSDGQWTATKVWIWLRTCVENFHILWDILFLGITAFGWRLPSRWYIYVALAIVLVYY